MNTLPTILIFFLAISFLFYGFSCLYSKKMQLEFTRFKLTQVQRKITGVLQILGGILLLVGYISPLIGLIAAGGLSLQMLLGFIVRLRIKDSFMKSSPSFIFMILNGSFRLFSQYLSIKYYTKATISDNTKNVNAGRLFLIGSLTLRCIIIAPSIKNAIPYADGSSKGV